MDAAGNNVVLTLNILFLALLCIIQRSLAVQVKNCKNVNRRILFSNNYVLVFSVFGNVFSRWQLSISNENYLLSYCGLVWPKLV